MTPITPFAPTDDQPTADSAHLLDPSRIGPRDGAGKTVVVAMSGGVDSAVTALVMRERGYNVVGMNLRLFSPEDEDHRDLRHDRGAFLCGQHGDGVRRRGDPDVH